MFDWIPFAVASVVLLWALASFRHAATGGQGAGLHEMRLPGTEAPGTEPEVAAERGGRSGAVLLGVVVVVVAIALLAYAVFAA
jgi:hypothetical protein